MTFEQLPEQVGQEVAVTDWVRIVQNRIAAFSEATDDRQWIHLRPEGAIAHGFLTLSMLSHLSENVLPVEGLRMRINYGLNRVRFPTPVPSGSSIRARFVLQSVKSTEAYADVTLAVTVELQGSEKPCCVAEWIVRYYRS